MIVVEWIPHSISHRNVKNVKRKYISVVPSTGWETFRPWGSSVPPPPRRFGKGTTIAVWEKTKKIAGYSPQPNGFVKGVGYAQNDKSQVPLVMGGVCNPRRSHQELPLVIPPP